MLYSCWYFADQGLAPQRANGFGPSSVDCLLGLETVAGARLEIDPDQPPSLALGGKTQQQPGEQINQNFPLWGRRGVRRKPVFAARQDFVLSC